MRLGMLGMEEETTLDELFDGNLSVFQRKKGYRFSLDAVLLAHFASLKKNSRLMDIGCGSGVIALILCKRFPTIHCVGLEIQQDLAELAGKNVRINCLDGRVEILCADARNFKKLFPANSFDAVIFNPPYRKLDSGRINPYPEKAIARHEIAGSLKDFLKAADYLLKPGGSVFSIYPARRMVELVSLSRTKGIEPKRMKVVFTDKDSDAVFILTEGKKDGREELKIERPLFIYDSEKIYSKEMNAIFRELSLPPSGGAG